MSSSPGKLLLEAQFACGSVSPSLPIGDSGNRVKIQVIDVGCVTSKLSESISNQKK